MKKQTKIILAILAPLLAISWISSFLVFQAPVRVSAFCAADDGKLFICMREQLLIVSPDDTIEQIRCPVDSPCKIEISEDNLITVYGFTFCRQYDLSLEEVGDAIDLPHTQRRQDLRKSISAGGSEYSYKSSFGRYRFLETKADGETILRYEMPVLDYAVMLCAIISSALVFAAIPLVLVHIFRNYKTTDRGKILWNEWKK